MTSSSSSRRLACSFPAIKWAILSLTSLSNASWLFERLCALFQCKFKRIFNLGANPKSNGLIHFSRATFHMCKFHLLQTAVEQHLLENPFHRLAILNLPRGTDRVYGDHVFFAAKDPSFLRDNKKVVKIYLVAHDPQHVRLVTSLRYPVDRIISEIGMFNKLWPKFRTDYQSIEGVAMAIEKNRWCMANKLCTLCGPKIIPEPCAEIDQVPRRCSSKEV